MKQNVIINQFFGIGDVIFTVSLARQLAGEHGRIVWAVLPAFYDQLKRAYPDIEWLDKSKNETIIDYNSQHLYVTQYDGEDFYVIPLRFASNILGEPDDHFMKSKYPLLKLDHKSWKTYGSIQRDSEREESLVNLLNLPKKFALCNLTYQSDFKAKFKRKIDTELPIVEMTTIQGFSMFDWLGVMERATEIHTVSTSLFYLLELFDFGDTPLHLYPRPTDPRFDHIKFLFTKNYVLH